MSDDASWISLKKTSQHAWTPSQPGWTNQELPLRHACSRRSQQVADAGALAPVVFSGDDEPQTCKIKEIEAKENPIPPKSTLLNPLVASVSAKNTCIDQFDSNRS